MARGPAESLWGFRIGQRASNDARSGTRLLQGTRRDAYGCARLDGEGRGRVTHTLDSCRHCGKTVMLTKYNGKVRWCHVPLLRVRCSDTVAEPLGDTAEMAKTDG